jgi:hypothetical protein
LQQSAREYVSIAKVNTSFVDVLISLSTLQRKEAVKRRGLCLNCLKRRHLIKDCQSIRCRKCSGSHNTLLHHEFESKEAANQADKSNAKEETKAVGLYGSCERSKEINEEVRESKPTSCTENSGVARVTYCTRKQTSHVLLSTAQVYVFDVFDNQRKRRILLDPGSQSVE